MKQKSMILMGLVLSLVFIAPGSYAGGLECFQYCEDIFCRWSIQCRDWHDATLECVEWSADIVCGAGFDACRETCGPITHMESTENDEEKERERERKQRREREEKGAES